MRIPSRRWSGRASVAWLWKALEVTLPPFSVAEILRGGTRFWGRLPANEKPGWSRCVQIWPWRRLVTFHVTISSQSHEELEEGAELVPTSFLGSTIFAFGTEWLHLLTMPIYF
jgi:hypothetical protein